MLFELVHYKLKARAVDKPEAVVKHMVKPPVKKTVHSFPLTHANAGGNVLRLDMKAETVSTQADVLALRHGGRTETAYKNGQRRRP